MSEDKIDDKWCHYSGMPSPSFYMNDDRCKKLIYNTDRERMYEELNNHLEDCKKMYKKNN